MRRRHSADHTYRVTEEQFIVAFQEEWTWNATRKRWRQALKRAAASSYWTEAEAQAVLEAYEKSGLSMAEFARRHGLGPQRLRWWKKRRAEEAGPAPSFVRVHVAEPLSRRAREAPTPGLARMEVVLAKGRRIRVEPGFDAEELARLVRVMEDACRRCPRRSASTCAPGRWTCASPGAVLDPTVKFLRIFAAVSKRQGQSMNDSNWMKYSIVLVALCLMSTGCSANSSLCLAPDEGVQGPPALVLWSIEASPNIDHSARVAVYPQGSVIYRQEDPVSGVPRYRQARLSSERYAQLAGPTRLKLLAALEESYFVSDAIGAPDNIIQWRTPEDRVRQRTVTGFLDPGADIERGRTPSAFLSLYDALVAFEPLNARAYVPETVEVILRSARSGDSAPWPPEWPAPLPSGFTDSESHGERLVASFPGSRLAEVLKWVSEHHQAGRLVTYNGQLYVAYVRAVLPGNPRVLSAAEANAPCAEVTPFEGRSREMKGLQLTTPLPAPSLTR